MDEQLARILDRIREERGRVVVLTGAGISAESGIPTFRGKEGYWTVGSEVYTPQEMATFAMFSQRPEEVWQWYLYRRTICRAADPNPAHLALVELERELGDRFLLITQNVDGLHLRAGNSLERTYQIHGNLDFVRCSRECRRSLHPFPEGFPEWDREMVLGPGHRDRLRCTDCGGWMRPHVLWFDECYDEEHYRFESSQRAAMQADLLLVVGTSGATNLPMQVGSIAASRGAALIDVNPDANPFSRLAESCSEGFHAQGAASALLPAIARRLTAPA